MTITAAGVGSTTREAIAASARELFEERGFAATSVRAIAAGAGVDAALVMRHFGSKEQLFVEVVGASRGAGPELDGPLETLGRRLVEHVLDPERDRERRAYAAMVRASDHDGVRESLRQAARASFIDGLCALLPGPDASARAELIAAQIGGLMQAWPTVGVELLDTVGRQRVVELYGAAIQALVDSPTG
ncbi:TetR family transcriptional regulator [Blastococcus sp. TF02A-26]|uniref:TetR/AcrR family transcriptional regulator n=1 Tax=Blastococcus sp. TF02A-26 TaxID=2250577 RepID=UPI000DEB5B0A|nr:TetR family transcriptional regulator [Blastococcus sp. TF02A-26]RBY85286.1 TetR/AcrR family transcriptional regulator [Blastococcus sp. TF02A-26]